MNFSVNTLVKGTGEVGIDFMGDEKSGARDAVQHLSCLLHGQLTWV